MKYRHVEVFLEVINGGTVTEAARRLGVSQPSVTTTLKQFEEQLGLVLFQRRNGRLVPTAEARTLAAEARRVTDALNTFELHASRLRQGQGGQLRVVAIPTLSLRLLPDAMIEFLAQDDHYSFSVDTTNTEAMLERLDARRDAFHVGFTLGTVDELHVRTEVIGDVDLLLVAPAALDLPAGDTVGLEALADAPCIASFAGTALAKACEALFAEAGIEPRITARIHTHHLAARMAQRGAGYTIVDALTAHALAAETGNGPLVLRRLDPGSSLPLTVIHPVGRHPHQGTQPFVDCLAEVFQRQRTELDSLLAQGVTKS